MLFISDKNNKNSCVTVFWSMEKLACNGTKRGREVPSPTNPDLANIMGDTDVDFNAFYFLDFLDSKFPDFQVPRFPDFLESGMGQAWAGPGPSLWGNRSCMAGEPPSRRILTDILSGL